MEGPRDELTDRQTNGQTDRPTNRPTEGWMDERGEEWAGKQLAGNSHVSEVGGWTLGELTDVWQAGGQTGKQMERRNIGCARDTRKDATRGKPAGKQAECLPRGRQAGARRAPGG